MVLEQKAATGVEHAIDAIADKRIDVGANVEQYASKDRSS
jgi:hypothetical protein